MTGRASGSRIFNTRGFTNNATIVFSIDFMDVVE